MAVGSGSARAVVARGAGSGADLLTEALDEAGFDDVLAGAVGRRKPASVRVIVAVADWPWYDGPRAVDPGLVERLLDLLAQRGFLRLAIAAAHVGPSAWVEPVARGPGARTFGRTAGGTPYDVLDLARDGAPGDFPPGSALHGAEVAAAWRDAEVRINVARNLTHPEWGHALCLANLLGTLPGDDRYYRYAASRDPGEVVSALLSTYPPQLNVLDASGSGHGVTGDKPIATNTVLVATDAVLADVVGATLQGVDPAVSPITAAALRRPGLPATYDLVGDLTPYAGWRPTPVAVREALRATPLTTRRVLLAGLAPVDRTRFALSDPALDRINATLTGLAPAAESPAGLAALVAALGTAAAAAGSVESWRTMVGKGRIRRPVTALGFDPAAYDDAEYDAVPGCIEPFEALLDALPPDRWGMRRTALDGSILFAAGRTVQAPYDDFVARVDIAHAIRLMNDYLGGATHVVSCDAQGRIVRQAERNIYLPQPNYLAVFGGRPIDVCKLQHITWADAEQKICWRTVSSPNGTATYDDGSVIFRAAEGGRATEVLVHVRQQFVLPLFWQVFDLDRTPELKDALVADAYRRFFTGTLDNIEAEYEGREFRIGRDWDADGEELPTAAVAQALAMARHALGGLRERLPSRSRRPAPAEIAADGFAHFAPAVPEPTRRDRLAGARAAARAYLDDLAVDVREAWEYDRRSASGR